MWMVRRFLTDKLNSSLKRKVKNKWRRMDTSVYHSVLQDQFRDCHDLKKYFNASAVESALAGCGRTELTTLFTVTSAIEDNLRGQSTLEHYAGVSFPQESPMSTNGTITSGII